MTRIHNLALLGAVSWGVFVTIWTSPAWRIPEHSPVRTSKHTSPAPVENVQQRLLELPEDGHTWHTILILQPNWQSLPAERRVEALFHSDPELSSLRHQTHWHLITTDQPEYRKFQQLAQTTPCLLVERANGQVIYHGCGPELNQRSPELTRAIRRSVERHCPRGRCLPIHPQPPFPPADRNRDADSNESDENEVPLLLRESLETENTTSRDGLSVALTAVGAALSGIAYQWKRNS